MTYPVITRSADHHGQEAKFLYTITDGSVQYQDSDQWVPRAVNLHVAPGQIVALLGPSGCGKSSISLTTNGLVPHSVPSVYRGSAQTCGTEVADGTIAQFATQVAIVQQDPDAQIVTTRVDEEVRFALENFCLPGDEVCDRAAKALQQVGLADYATHNPWELSGGQRQRLALACALAMEPQLLVLDEATANIDPASAQLMYRLVAERAKQGLGVLLIEHELDRVIGSVDTVVAISRDGNPIACGHPREVFYNDTDQLRQAGIWLPTPVSLAQRFPQVKHARPLTFDETLSALTHGGVSADTLRQHKRYNDKETTLRDGLSVRNLNAGYGAVTVVHDVSFDAPAGAITAIIGANGSGKSTLMAAIAGLHRDTSATQFCVGGRKLTPTRPHHDIGYVFQNPQHQFIRSTVREELEHSFQVHRQEPDDINHAVEQLLRDFDLQQYAQSSPYQLSGGQQRRLSVATTMGEQRQVICFDEPTFGQDQHSADQLTALMRALADRGQAVIIATHDMSLVAHHADRVVLLDGGRVVAKGTPHDVFSDDAALATGLQPPMTYRLAAALDGKPIPTAVPTTVKPRAHITGAVDTLLSRLDLRRHLGPLTSFLAIMPMLFVVLLVAKPYLGFLTMVVATVAIIGFSGRPVHYTVTITAVVWLFAVMMVWGTSLSYIPQYHGVGHPVFLGPITMDSIQLDISLAMGARIGAMVMLLIFSGATADPQALVKALSRYFHVPVRITYAGVASISFAHRFRVEHRIIMTARRLRRAGGSVPVVAGIIRWFGSIVPLMVNAVRHAENVSMAMDARGFGAYRRRTVIDDVTWRWTDTAFLLGTWMIMALGVWYFHSHGLIGGFYYGRY